MHQNAQGATTLSRLERMTNDELTALAKRWGWKEPQR